MFHGLERTPELGDEWRGSRVLPGGAQPRDQVFDGHALAVTTPTPPAAHGTVVCTAAGACTYTPAGGYHGPDSFSYAISDGHGGTGTASATA